MNILKYSKEYPVNSECKDFYIEYNQQTKDLIIYAIKVNIYETQYDYTKFLEFQKKVIIHPDNEKYLMLYNLYVARQELMKMCQDILPEISETMEVKDE